MYSVRPDGRPPSAAARAGWTKAGIPELTALAAAADLAAGEPASAERRSSAALRRAPALGAALLCRAAARLALGRRRRTNHPLAGCLADLDAFLAKAPDDARALRLRAEVRNDLEDVAGARADLERLLRLDAEDGWARVELADLLCDSGSFDEAWPHIVALAPKHAKDGWYWALRGRALATTGRTAEGLAALAKASRLSPRHAAVRAWHGEALRVNGRYEAALAEFGAAVAADPGFLYAYEWRGRLLVMLGRPREALKDLDKNFRADARHYFAPAYRGEALFKLGRLREAARDFERAYPLDPAATWNPRVGEGERPCLRPAALRRDLDAAVAERAADPWAWAFRGRCRATAGDAWGALKDLTEALRLAPKNGYARAWRGQALLRLGAPKRALEDLRGAPGRWARAWEGEALAALGRHAPALKAYDAALAPEDPRFAAVHALKGASLKALGRARAAEGEAAQARRWGYLEQGASKAAGAGFACAPGAA
jgi:tetratricopeptide (TPR) repeat protein